MKHSQQAVCIFVGFICSPFSICLGTYFISSVESTVVLGILRNADGNNLIATYSSNCNLWTKYRMVTSSVSADWPLSNCFGHSYLKDS